MKSVVNFHCLNLKSGENHHIIPKSIRPDLIKDKSNIVRLTYREHYVAHLCLYKIYESDPENRFKMVCAWMRMCKNTNGLRVTSHEFEMAKLICSKNQRENPREYSEEERNRISIRFKKLLWWNNGTNECRCEKCPDKNWVKGRLFSPKGLHHWSPEERKRISEIQKGKQAGENNHAFGKHWWNNGIKQKYQKECPGDGWLLGFLSLKGKSHPAWNKGKCFSFSEEQKLKLYASRRGKTPPNKGKPMSEEQKVKLREAWKRRKLSN